MLGTVYVYSCACVQVCRCAGAGTAAAAAVVFEGYCELVVSVAETPTRYGHPDHHQSCISCVTNHNNKLFNSRCSKCAHVGCEL